MAIAPLRLLSHDVQHGIDKLRALGVVALRPIVPRAGLPEDKVVRAEELPERPSADAVHGPGLQVHEDRARDVTAAGGLVVVDVDPLELQVGVAVVGARRVDAMLVRDHLPELRADLIAALATLDVHELAHDLRSSVAWNGEETRPRDASGRCPPPSVFRNR